MEKQKQGTATNMGVTIRNCQNMIPGYQNCY